MVNYFAGELYVVTWNGLLISGLFIFFPLILILTIGIGLFTGNKKVAHTGFGLLAISVIGYTIFSVLSS